MCRVSDTTIFRPPESPRSSHGGGVGCPTGAICPRCPSVSRLPRPRDMVPGPLPHQDHAHRTRNRLTTSPPTLVCARNNNSTIKKARLRFFVFLNKKETTQVACFNSHKKGKEPHPAFLHCGIVEARSPALAITNFWELITLSGIGRLQNQA